MTIVKRIVLAVCLMTTLAVVAAAQAPMNASDTDATGAGQTKKSLYARLARDDALDDDVANFI
jgi:hypothetical protein